VGKKNYFAELSRFVFTKFLFVLLILAQLSCEATWLEIRTNNANVTDAVKKNILDVNRVVQEINEKNEKHKE